MRSVSFVVFVVVTEAVCWDGVVRRLACVVVFFLCRRSCWYMAGMSMCLLKVSLFVLCQASLNCLARRVLACPSTLVSVRLKVCPCSSAWLAGSDSGSWRLIALLCSCKRVSTFFDVSPMYVFVQSLQENV